MLKLSLRAAGEAGGASLRAAGLATPAKQAEKEALAEAELPMHGVGMGMGMGMGMAASLGQKLAEVTRVSNPSTSSAIAAAAEAAVCVTTIAVEAASTIELATATLNDAGLAKDNPGRLSRAAGSVRRWYGGRAVVPLSPGHGPIASD